MKSHRPDKVASLIRMVVSDMIANKLNDPRISRFASVTRVEVSGDLQIAKVYISVMGDDTAQRKTMTGLEHARGHIQRTVAKAVTARQCPHLRFVSDPSIKRAAEIIRIIDENVPPVWDEPDEPAEPAESASGAEHEDRSDGAPS